MADKNKEIEEPLDIEIGDSVNVIEGKEKGEVAKVIAVYNNSIAIELNKQQKDGTLARTVISHSEYEKVE